MECAATGRQPPADLALAQTIKMNDAGYWAAIVAVIP
jgi:hypothetical protein